MQQVNPQSAGKSMVLLSRPAYPLMVYTHIRIHTVPLQICIWYAWRWKSPISSIRAIEKHQPQIGHALLYRLIYNIYNPFIKQPSDLNFLTTYQDPKMPMWATSKIGCTDKYRSSRILYNSHDQINLPIFDYSFWLSCWSSSSEA